MKIKWPILIPCFLIVLVVALIGSYFVSLGINSEWYTFIKPNITPPSYVFSIVWPVLYFLIALSMYFSYIKLKKKKDVVLPFGSNLLLNLSWSFFYFTLNNAKLAFVDISLLVITTIWIMKLNWKSNRKSSILLVPYLLWLLFASYLNYLSI